MNRILLIVWFWGINAAISQTVIYHDPFENTKSWILLGMKLGVSVGIF